MQEIVAVHRAQLHSVAQTSPSCRVMMFVAFTSLMLASLLAHAVAIFTHTQMSCSSSYVDVLIILVFVSICAYAHLQ